MKISEENLLELINEAFESLDEKISIPIKNSTKEKDILDDLSVDPNDDWFRKNVDINAWKSFANQDNQPSAISSKDFQAAYGKGKQSPNRRAADQAMRKTKSSTVKTDLRTAAGIDPNAPKATPLGGEKLAPDAGSFGKTDRSDRAASIPSVDLPYSGLVGKKGTGVTGTIKLEAAGKIDPSTLDAFEAFYRIDPTLMGAKGTTNTLEGRFDLISQFAKAVKGKKPADIANLKALQPEDLMACGVVLKTLGSLFNLFQGASAGTVFEGIIALITGGVIYGGAGGAVDNLAGKMGDVYTSAKQYKDKHTTSQALGGAPGSGSEGLIAHCAAAKSQNKVVWYISASKAERGKKTDLITAVEILFAGVGVDDATNPTKFIFYNGDGTVTGAEVSILDAKKSAKDDKWDFSAYSKTSDTRYVIPFVEAGKDPSIESIDKMIADGLKKTGKLFVKAAMAANNKIDSIAKETLSYSTTGDSQRASSIRSKYMAVKGDFNKMFTVKGHTKITENEINSLKTLDKLIEQVILYT